MSNIKHIFFDFNGTLIDDVDLCLELLNKILISQNKPLVDLKKYKNIFTFPIKKYYENAGVDFNIESYESLSIKFINEYQPRSMTCGLFPCVVPTLEYLYDKANLYILSASERNNLLEQCNNYDISKYFKAILGIDNIHAASKVQIAVDYIKENNINPLETIFIGDTLHDVEVAKAIGVKAYLVTCGHQSKEVLETSDAIIVDDIGALKNLI